MNTQNKLTTFRVNQNQQEFFICKLTIKQLLTITKYTERLITGWTDDEKPKYNKEVQRRVEPSRVNKIADFLIDNPDAAFPTNIVLNIPDNVIKNATEEKGLTIFELDEIVIEEVEKEKGGVERGNIFISIIDGQHRIRGIEKAIERLQRETQDNPDEDKNSRLEDLQNIEILVSFFVGMSLEFQAMVFSTINRTQKRVSQDLVYSLFGLTTDDTPYKTALEVVLALNGHPKSPFYRRIKVYGGSYSRKEARPLSQSSMIKSIVSLISETIRDSERDIYKSRKELKKQGNSKTLPFRMFYAENEDEKILKTLNNYFNAVKECFKNDKGESYWEMDTGKPDNILQTTVGYTTLIKILVDIFKYSESEYLEKPVFVEKLSKAKDLPFDDQSHFPFSTRGKNILYLKLSLAIWDKLTDSAKDDRQERLNNILNKDD